VRFLADAHISAEMIAMLHDLGHDCLDSSAIPPRMQDIDVLRMAADDARVVVTSDKDFGELLFVPELPWGRPDSCRAGRRKGPRCTCSVGVVHGAVTPAWFVRDDHNVWRSRQADTVTARKMTSNKKR
jgi:hypothetical protein